ATARRCEGLPFVLIAQDTCTFVYDQHHILGLGRVNGSQRSAGLLGHTALAMTPQGTPLGLWHAELWGEHDATAIASGPKTGSPGEKESCKWKGGLAAVAQRLPVGTEGLLIQDREADIFDFLAVERPTRL